MKTWSIPKAPARASREKAWCRDHRGRDYPFDQAMDLARKFHGHASPGLLIGVKMVTHVMARLPEDRLFDALCETRSCLPDAVQTLTLCTVGNGWLKILDLGRFALTLYDKYEGSGVRVFLDPKKLHAWPEISTWFLKLKPKEAQDPVRLLEEIREARESILSFMAVRLNPPYLLKRKKGPIKICPRCGEAYPAGPDGLCKGCLGENPFERL